MTLPSNNSLRFPFPGRVNKPDDLAAYSQRVYDWMNNFIGSYNMLLQNIQRTWVNKTAFTDADNSGNPTASYFLANAYQDDGKIFRKAYKNDISWALKFDLLINTFQILHSPASQDPIVWDTYFTVDSTGSYAGSAAPATKTTNYTVLTSDSVIFGDCTAGGVTFTLPTAVGIAGKRYNFKKIDGSANHLIIAAHAAETIDGAATVSIATQWQSLTIISNGANWFTL